MRALAANLGFGVMSLYNHVADKSDLLDGMVDLVANEILLPPTKAKWRLTYAIVLPPPTLSC